MTAENNKNSNTRECAWGEGMLKLQIDRCINAIVLLSTHIWKREKHLELNRIVIVIIYALAPLGRSLLMM